ncbi:hypothetical protein [Nocardia abscessus]|uniref:hypothetical protein n=1 Tax=Nocardia abscessus TaxID=120957 RepID=UPI003CC7F965
MDTVVVQQTPLHIPEIAAGPPPRAPGIVLATNWGRVRRPRVPGRSPRAICARAS